ncbi:hypothetical protein LINPERHAP1_LOCUS14681 [Linum perenne]
MEFWSGRFLGQSRRNYHDADPPLCTVWRGSFINSLLTQIRVLFLTLASIQIGVWRKDVGPPIGFSSNESNFPFCAGVPVCSFRFGWFVSFLGSRFGPSFMEILFYFGLLFWNSIFSFFQLHATLSTERLRVVVGTFFSLISAIIHLFFIFFSFFSFFSI